MVKITVEIDGIVATATPAVLATQTPIPAAADTSSISGPSPPEAVLAQALAIGALNGGPAPSIAALSQSSPAPVASSLGGAPASHGAVSAGSAPPSAFMPSAGP